MLNSILKKLTILSILSLLFVFAPITTSSNDAIAQDTYSATDANALTGTMCRAFQLATGTAGKTFAAFAIISMGLGFFTGKVSWGLMIGVMAGIAAIFGAPTMVSAIGGEEAMNCEAVLKQLNDEDADATTPAADPATPAGTTP
jgi:type IV secretory pathway VirB2 component (pilin)